MGKNRFYTLVGDKCFVTLNTNGHPGYAGVIIGKINKDLCFFREYHHPRGFTDYRVLNIYTLVHNCIVFANVERMQAWFREYEERHPRNS